MEIYRLTNRGYMLSHSTKSPHTPEWRIIHHLAKVGHSTKEGLVGYLGLGEGEASRALSKLKIKRIIMDETGVSV